ncbi:MAG: Clostripain family protein [Lachnospiraceae bacterium]|nr:Clostripain family protein [Lachnospiraceae bacterium]
MKKRFLGLLAAFTVLFTCTGCLDDEWDEEPEAEETTEEEDVPEEGEPQKLSGGDAKEETPVRGLSMNVNRDNGKLEIKRSRATGSAAAGESGWTIFVYLCGTDLESDAGMGTGDLEEMLEMDEGDGVRFVVQTGGTNEWNNDVVEDGKIQRYLVTSDDISLVDEESDAGMGKSNTLSDFLIWGTENYASEHMGVILWNHGGGSITGVCFDETAGYDSLSLKELDEAFYACYERLGRKLDFVGFDACLMGNVECANILATYADYMYGSEETEPGSGWDYTAIGDFLVNDPDADGAALGKTVCDSFLAACKAQDEDDLTTLSVIDLSKMDDLLVSFNDFAKEMYEAGEDASMRAEMVRGIEDADNFGGNNKSEGYTNMVDMGGIIEACGAYTDSAAAVQKALDAAVVYSVSGPVHKGASGMSMYYPLSVGGSNELGIFGEICISPYYLSFVDRQNQTGAGALDDEDYDDNSWFDDDGDWSWGDSEDDDYWDYLDDYEQTGESRFITFAQEPILDEDGTFWFELDDNGWYNAMAVSAIVYELTEDMETMIELGETVDVNGDWETGIFYDNFDGYWLSLPDGQNLATYIVEDTEDYVIYTSPVYLNGEETNLRLKQYYSDGSVVIEGAWDGIDEYGAASREIIKLQKGDVIIPAYYAYGIDDDDEFEYVGDEYVFTGDPEIYYDFMESGDYMYSFCIDDIYGDYYLSDPVMFNVDKNGEVSFYED